jgi:8-oxo-dGTP pyrophosphatase MutT (NUDIX family)
VDDRRRRLAVALRSHGPGDEREAGHRRRVLELLDGAADPFSRDSFDPGHLTASGFVLHPAGDKLLVVFHQAMQRWLQPGGHIEPDDADVTAAAAREVEEETGLGDLEPVGEGIFDVDVHAVAHGGPPHLHFDLRVRFLAGGDKATPGNGVEAVRWVSLADLEAERAEESLLRPARKALGRS